MLGDTVNKETSFNTNWATHTTSAYIQCFCLYLNQQTAASNAWTFCVCTWRTHTHTTNTLSYSFSHSVELPLCFTGVVLHHLRETVTFTQNNLDTVRRTFQFIGANAVPAHYLLSFWCSRTFFLFCCSSASLQGSVCIWLCIQFKHMPFAFHQRYGQLLSQKASST